MTKIYILSSRNDKDIEQMIYNMDSYHLRIALYGIARGWKFDEAISIAEEAYVESIKRAQNQPTSGTGRGISIPK